MAILALIWRDKKYRFATLKKLNQALQPVQTERT
jgi:hypothetical protein